MLTLYVRALNRLAEHRRTALDDRGAVSVEQAILIGVVAAAAIAVGTGLTILVNRKIAEWSAL